MKDGPRTELSAIEFYLREPERSTRYTRRRRLYDAWIGHQDSFRLSSAQKEETGDPGSIPLTSWTHEMLRHVEDITLAEQLVCDTAVDLALRELAILPLRVAHSEDTLNQARDAEAESLDKGPDSSAPVGAAEAHDEESIRIKRRNGHHQKLLAAHRARAGVAEAEAAAARFRIQELEKQIQLANAACEKRIARYRAMAARRLMVYARAISRRHPEAGILQTLSLLLGNLADEQDYPTLRTL